MSKKQGRIIGNISNIYEVKYDEESYNCTAKGKFKKENITPTVGDLVEVEVISQKEKTAVITNVLDRDTYIKRPRLANISQLILVISTKMPNPDLLMLDKQLVFAKYLKIEPIIVINKIDLDNENIANEIRELYTRNRI